MHGSRITELYQAVLGHGLAGTERFYTALRRRGISPQPNPQLNEPNLYAPNPVLVPAQLVQRMTADANRFCDALLDAVPDAVALLERAPRQLVNSFASREVAEQIRTSLRRAHPLTHLDAFLVETPDGLQPAYLEWQTVGTYVTLGMQMLASAAEAWPELAEDAAHSAWSDVTRAQLADHLRALYTRGIEDDPRQGIILDYLPHQQPTRHEFYAIQQLTGGTAAGMGIVDPRQVVVHHGRPHYERDGILIPVRRVYSRVVYSDLVKLLQETVLDQQADLRRFFQDAEHVTWISHPLHFFYGSKADFPDFWQLGLSSALPESRHVTAEMIEGQMVRSGTDQRLHGYVLKPTDRQSGHSVTLDPLVADLRPGWILQRQIEPADCHLTLWGPRTPEVRMMCVPDEQGRLMTGIVYTRVKDPDVFLSNAGHIAQLQVPGTGEGYAVVIHAP